VFRIPAQGHSPAVCELLKQDPLRRHATVSRWRVERSIDLDPPPTERNGKDAERHNGSPAQTSERRNAGRKLGYTVEEPDGIRPHPVLRVVTYDQDRLAVAKQPSRL
jgi:hypothetical protein